MWLAALAPPSLRINLFEKRYSIEARAQHVRTRGGYHGPVLVHLPVGARCNQGSSSS